MQCFGAYIAACHVRDVDVTALTDTRGFGCSHIVRVGVCIDFSQNEMQYGIAGSLGEFIRAHRRKERRDRQNDANCQQMGVCVRVWDNARGSGQSLRLALT